MNDSMKGQAGLSNHVLLDKFKKVNKKHRAILEKRLNKTDLYRGLHQVLMCIYRNPNTSQKEIAEYHSVSAATIAVSLKKLEQEGYVSKVVNPKDNRLNTVNLTSKGQEVAEKSSAFFTQIEDAMFEGITEEEKETLYRVLNRMEDNLSVVLNQ